MPATIEPARAVPRVEAGRLDLPQRVAQVLGDREDVGQQVGGVDPRDLLAVQPVAVACWTSYLSGRWLAQNVIAPSGNSVAGKTRTPRVSTLPAPDRDALAEHRAARDSPRPRRCGRPAPTMQSLQRRSRRRSSAPSSTTERSTVAPAPDRHAVAEHDEAADVRARGDRAAALDDRGRDDPAVDSHSSATARKPAPRRSAPRSHVALEDVERALEVALGRPDVEPVGVGGVGRTGRRRRARPDLALDRDVAARRDQVEHAALEHVRAGADEVRVDLVGASASRRTPRTERSSSQRARGRRRSGPRPARARACRPRRSPRAGRSARSGRCRSARRR